MIFLHHLGYYPGGGGLAVSVFLILSGFCLSIGYGEKINTDGFSYWEYAKRRISKLLPLHWFSLLLVLLLSYLGLMHSPIAAKTLLMNAALLHAWVPMESYYFSYNALSWYVSVALFLMLLFPSVFGFIANQSRREIIKYSCLALLLYGVFFMAVPNDMRHPLLYINPIFRIFEFVVGIFAAHVYKCNKLRTRSIVDNHPYLIDATILVSLSTLVILSIVIQYHHLTQYLFAVYWLPAVVLIVSVALQHDTPMAKFMSSNIVFRLTQSSFSFFMIHLIVIQCFLSSACDIANSAGGGAMIFFVAYMASQILYYVFEKYVYATMLKVLR